MNPLIPLKKAIPLFLVALLLACFAIVCVVQAQSPTPSESPIASPSPTGVARASFEQKECARATGRNAHFLAKYKQSTSCSYTPAILAYGKVADALKIHVDVPAVVYRTMEQATHKGVEKMAGVYAHDL